MEVLISVGVMAVGLLFVASLIPVGSFAVSETAKADRSAALGRAAMHEVRVRNMLEPFRDDRAARWCLAKKGFCFDSSVEAQQYRNLFLLGQPIAIDPLFATNAATQVTSDNFDWFPFVSAGGSWTLNSDSRLIRLRLDIFEDASLRMKYPGFNYADKSISIKVQRSTLQLPVVDRIFTWRDDLIFDVDEDNPDWRPRQSCLWSDGAVAPYPNASATATPLFAQANDNYSWMLTAVPDPSELPSGDINALTAHRQKTYTVSIVAFYKRDFTCDDSADPPSERFVEIQFNGTGIGGGDARLMVPTAGITPEQAQEYLKVKEGEWIMVTGFVRDLRLDPIFVAPNGRRRIAKWYRVIRVDDEIDPNTYPNAAKQDCYARNITLAGPDWDPDWQYYIGTLYNQPRATIIDGVIGVYTTTVTIE